MEVTITPQSITTAAAVIGAALVIVGYFIKVHNWFLKQQKQDEEIKNLQKTHDDDIAEIKEEQTIMMYGVLACLKGLKEQGCNGPVTEAINKLENHLNEKAHK